MIGKVISMGIDVATLPARLALRGTKLVLGVPGELLRNAGEIGKAAEQAVQEFERLASQVDLELGEKASHLDGRQKLQAAELALGTAEKHLSMAAVDLLRALWLFTHSRAELAAPDREQLSIERQD